MCETYINVFVCVFQISSFYRYSKGKTLIHGNHKGNVVAIESSKESGFCITSTKMK